MSFFIVPVKAYEDVEFYQVPEYSFSAYRYFFNHGYNNLIYTADETYTETYSVNLSETGTINSSGSTLGAKYLTCTTNNAVSGTQTYSCYFSDRQNAVSNSQSINIKLNANESISGTIGATHRQQDFYVAKLPFLSGTYSHNTSFNSNDRIWLTTDRNDQFYEWYFIFYSSSRIKYGGLDLYFDRGNSVDYTFNDTETNGSYLNVIHFFNCDKPTNLTFDINDLNSQSIIPIFIGTYKTMPDDVAVMANIRPSISYLLENGNNSTRTSVENATTAKNNVSNKINNFDSLESNSVNNMNSNINNLNITSDILTNSKFLSSANWVKVQFDRMTVNTPIGSVLSFSLILGITLIFLGKIR